MDSSSVALLESVRTLRKYEDGGDGKSIQEIIDEICKILNGSNSSLSDAWSQVGAALIGAVSGIFALMGNVADDIEKFSQSSYEAEQQATTAVNNVTQAVQALMDKLNAVKSDSKLVGDRVLNTK